MCPTRKKHQLPTHLEFIPLVISLAAFGFSLVTYFQQRRKDRRDLFIAIHTSLIDADLQQGRRLLGASQNDAAGFAQMRDDNPADYQLINRALAMFDILSMYVIRGYLDERIVLEEWGHTFARTWDQAQPYIDARCAMDGYPPWSSLHTFGPHVATWAKKHPRAPRPLSPAI